MHGSEDDVRELGAHLGDYLDRATTQCKPQLRSARAPSLPIGRSSF
jgi:hypothetical protein